MAPPTGGLESSSHTRGKTTAAPQPAVSGCSQSSSSLAAPGTPWTLSLLPSRPTTALGYRGILRQEPGDSDLSTTDTAISHPREQPYLPVGRNQLQETHGLAVRDPRTPQHPSVTEQWPQRQFEPWPYPEAS